MNTWYWEDGLPEDANTGVPRSELPAETSRFADMVFWLPFWPGNAEELPQGWLSFSFVKPVRLGQLRAGGVAGVQEDVQAAVVLVVPPVSPPVVATVIESCTRLHSAGSRPRHRSSSPAPTIITGRG